MSIKFHNIFRILLLGLLLITVPACDEHTFIDDFFDIHQELDKLKDSHRDIQQRIDNVHESIVTIQAIVDVINSGQYIEKVTLEDNYYVFLFSSGKTIKIRANGMDGADGPSPRMGVTLIDGIYYWTVNGEILYDDAGNKVPVVSDTVKTPLFSVSNGFWYLSYDGGITWRLVGRATGEEGNNGADGIENVIRIDQSSADVVVFILADGTTLTVPYHVEIRIIFNTAEGSLPIAGRETIHLTYTISGATENTRVDVSTDGYYVAQVIPSGRDAGTIRITCPRTFSDGYVNVIVYNNTGISDMKIIRFYEKQIEFEDGVEFQASPEGGIVTVPFSVNFACHAEVDAEAADWLSIENSGTSGFIELRAAANVGIARTGMVYIIPDNSEYTFAVIYISQPSSLCQIDKLSFMVPFEGGTFLSSISTSFGVSAKVSDEAGWLVTDVLPDGKDKYIIAMTVDPNSSMDSRAVNVDIYSADGAVELAVIRLVQSGRNLDLEYAMVFVVNPNFSNDFTAYLPIDINNNIDNDFDCFVDWGDGTGDHYKRGDDFYVYPEGQRNVHHKYEGLTVGRTFEVVVTGTVVSLNAERIPVGLRSSVKEVKQWGKTGLKRMYNAFKGFSGLETLHLDETGAFEDVGSFDYAFAECPRLVTVSEHLFDYATNATSFNGIFRNCERLVIIPEHLFQNTVKAQYFNEAFYGCSRLTSVPETLFSSCTEVKTFVNTFARCRSLNYVPRDLFANCLKVESFNCLFRECNSLTTIDEGLFRNNLEVTNMGSLFSSCRGLITIPPALFDNQRKVTEFGSLFWDCYMIESESPYTVINGQKVHLYERCNFPDYFVCPIYYGGCFSGCRRMTDFNNIPNRWQ